LTLGLRIARRCVIFLRRLIEDARIAITLIIWRTSEPERWSRCAPRFARKRETRVKIMFYRQFESVLYMFILSRGAFDELDSARIGLSISHPARSVFSCFAEVFDRANKSSISLCCNRLSIERLSQWILRLIGAYRVLEKIARAVYKYVLSFQPVRTVESQGATYTYRFC